MRMENIEEMPLHHTHWCKEGDEEMILEYNKNDVLATYLFLNITADYFDCITRAISADVCSVRIS